MSGSEIFDHDYIETPDDAISFVDAEKNIVKDTKKDLDDLQDDIDPSSESSEIQKKSDEQYYFLGQTKVESGDLRDVTDAIDSHDGLSDATITITGGADQIFMSEAKGQQVLDAEIVKLQTLKSSFSGTNVLMINQLITELTNQTNHKNLADRYPRGDKRSNLGNARLVAARIASGYVEVLMSIQEKMLDTGTKVSVTYDIPWEDCIIGTSGSKLIDRKINVQITMQVEKEDDEDQNEDEIPPVNDEDEMPPTNDEDEIPPVNDEDEMPPVNDEDEVPPADDPVEDGAEYLSDMVRMQIGTAFLFVRQNHLAWTPPSPYRYGPGSNNPRSLWSSYGTDGSESVAIYDKVGSKVFEIVLRKDAPPLLGLGPNMLPVTDVNQLMAVLDDISMMDKVTFDAFLLSLRPSTPNTPPPVVDEEPVHVEIERGSNEIILSFPNNQGDIVTAAGHPGLFTKDAQGNYFPDIAKIQKYYADHGLDVEFVVPSQTFEHGNVLTQHTRDDGVEGPASARDGDLDHKENDLADIRAAGKGVLWIDKNGVLHFSHSDEITQSDLDNAKDIAILPSVVRKGTVSDSDKRYDADPTRYVVLQGDVVSIVTLYGKDKNVKQDALKKYDRALYLDVAGANGQLFGYWTMQDGKLVYGNNKGDILRDGKIPTEVVKGNMPSLLIMTKPKKQDRVKEDPVSLAPQYLNSITTPNVTIVPPTSIPVEQPPKKIVEEPVFITPVDQNHIDAPDVTIVPPTRIPIEKPKPVVTDEPEPVVTEPPKNIESPFVYGSKEWLASKLTGKLEGISLVQFTDYIEGKSLSIAYNNPYNKEPFTIKNTISGIDNPILRDKVLSYIDRGDIRGMYENIYGMHDNNAINPYLHYRPIDKITPMMMHAMSLRLWHAHDIVANKEQLDRIKMPDDVREVWKDYKRLKLHLLSEKNGPNNFAIVSKTDFKMYLFLPDGTLVGTQNILVGKNPSDTQRLVSNTPSGKYKTNGFFNKPSFNAKYYDKGLGNYIKLWSLEDKFKNVQRNNAGIGIHELYDPINRASALLDDVTKGSGVRNRKRVSDGCINASNSPLDFGSIFTHLVPKSDVATCVYVTTIPNENTVYNYYTMLQQQAPIVMK